MHTHEHPENDALVGFRTKFAARRRRFKWVSAIAMLVGVALLLSGRVPSWVIMAVVVCVWAYRAHVSACPACGHRQTDILESGRCRGCDIVLGGGVAAAAVAGPPPPHGYTPSLAPEYIRDDTTRQSIAVLLLVGSLCLAAPWLDSTIRGVDPPYSGLLHGFVVPVTIALSAAGGALYHAVRRFRPEGLCAGAVSGAGGLAFSYAYFTHGGSMSSPTPMFVAMLGGVIPGGFVYWLLMRRQIVTRTESEEVRRRRA